MWRALGFSRRAAATSAESHRHQQRSPFDNDVPPDATTELPTREDIATARRTKPAPLQLGRLTDQEKKAKAIQGRWKAAGQISLDPNSEYFRQQEAFFQRLLNDPSWSIEGILTEYFTEHEKRLFIPADPKREPLLHRIQEVNRRRFAALLSPGDPMKQKPPGPFAGQRADLAFKLTMLYFGLPTEPMVFDAKVWQPPRDEDESDWDGLESEAEFVPEEPLQFLNRHMDRTWGKDILRGEDPDSTLEMYYKTPNLLTSGQSYQELPLDMLDTLEPESVFGAVTVGIRGGGSSEESDSCPGDEDTEMPDANDLGPAESLPLLGGDADVGGAGEPERLTMLYGLQGRVQINIASPEAFYGGVDALLGLVQRKGVRVRFRLYDTKAKKIHSSESIKLGSSKAGGDPAQELRIWERLRAKLDGPGGEDLAIVVVLRRQLDVLDMYGDDLPLIPDRDDKYIVEFTLDGGDPSNVAYLCMPVDPEAVASVTTAEYRAWFRTITRILHCEPGQVGANQARTDIAAFFGLLPDRQGAASYGGEYWPRALWDQVVTNVMGPTPQKRLKLWRTPVQELGTPTSYVLRIPDYPKSPHDTNGVAIVNKEPEALISLLQEYLVEQDYYTADELELTIHSVDDPDKKTHISISLEINSAEHREYFTPVREHCSGRTVVTARPIWGLYWAHGPEAQAGVPPPEGVFVFRPDTPFADFKRVVLKRWFKDRGVEILRIDQRLTERQIEDVASEEAGEAADDKAKAASVDRAKRMVSNAAVINVDGTFGEAEWDEFKRTLSQRRLYVHAVPSPGPPMPYTWGYHDAEAARPELQAQPVALVKKPPPAAAAAAAVLPSSAAALPSTAAAAVLPSTAAPLPSTATVLPPTAAAVHAPVKTTGPAPTAPKASTALAVVNTAAQSAAKPLLPPTAPEETSTDRPSFFPDEQPKPLPRGEPGWLYTQPLGPQRIATESERAQRLREYSYAHPLHIHNEGQGVQIPINAPPVEHLQRVPSDNVPAVEAQVLTPSEQARLQKWVTDFRNLALSRTMRCPYEGCWVFLPVDDATRWTRHLAQKHQAEKCNFCDEPLFRHWTPEQQIGHFLAKHSELFSAKTDVGRDNNVVMRSLHRVDHREERYHFCPRCGRDHSALMAPADRTQHDNQCYPGLQSVNAWCQDCGKRVDKSELVVNLLTNTRQHQCERPLKELAAAPGHPFCTDCGLSLGVFSPNYAKKHQLFCKGVSTADRKFCPWCGVDVGRDRDTGGAKHEVSCGLRPAAGGGPSELNASVRYAAAGPPDPFGRDTPVKPDSPGTGYSPRAVVPRRVQSDDMEELRRFARRVNFQNRLGDIKKQQQVVDRSLYKRRIAGLEEELRKAKEASKAPADGKAPVEQAGPGEKKDDPIVIEAEEAEAVPVKAMPVKDVPAKAVPAKAVPVKAEPAKAVPFKDVPAEAVPVKAMPVKDVPAEAVPVKAEPAKAVPFKDVPAKAVPFKAVPVKAEPAKAVPVKAVPVKAEPVWDVPAKAVPFKAVPVKAAPAKAAPAKEPGEKAPSTLETTAAKTTPQSARARKAPAPGSKAAAAKPRSRKRARSDSDELFGETSTSSTSSSGSSDDGEGDAPGTRSSKRRRRRRGEKDPTFLPPRKYSNDGEDDETSRAPLEPDELPLPGGETLVIPAEEGDR